MSNKEKFIKFISGKGFYAVLAVCLIGAGTAAWVAVDKTMDSIEKNNKEIIDNNSSKNDANTNWEYENIEETQKDKKDVKIHDSASSSSATKDKVSEKSSAQDVKKDVVPDSSKQLRPQAITYIMPVEGEVINPYSEGKLIKDVTLNEWRTHNGVDIKATTGGAVVAIATGKVENISKDKLWGDIIEISHADGTTAIYSGTEIMDNIKVGDMVRQQQQIGRVSKIPCEVALEPHIHFAMKKDGIWVNPLKQMNLQK